MAVNSSWRRHLGYGGGLLAFAVVFAVGELLLAGSQFWRSAWADTLWTLAAAYAALECVATARYVEARKRRIWYAFATAAACWVVAMLIWTWEELVLGNFTPFPSLADIGFTAYPIFMVVGFLMLPSRHQLVYGVVWKVATILIFASTVLFIFTAVLFAAASGTTAEDIRWIALASPVTHTLAFFYAGFIALQHSRSRIFGVTLLLALSLLVHALVNFPYASSLIANSYQVGWFLDAGWVVALGLLGWGARYRRQLPADQMTEISYGTLWEVLIPAFCGIGGLLVLFASLGRIDPAGYPYLLGFAILYLSGAAAQKFALLRSEERRAEIARDANAALLASEARFRHFAELSADWFWETDLDQRFKYISSTEVFDKAPAQPEKWVGRTRWEMTPELTGTTIAESIQSYMDRGEEFHDLRHHFVHSERGETWISISGKPVRDVEGTLIGYRGIGENITAQEVARRKLKEQELLLRLVIDNVPSTVYLKDLDGRFLLANSKQLKFLNRSQDEVIGRNLSEIFDSEWAQEYERQDREVIESREIRSYDIVVEMDDGQHRLHVTKFPVFDTDGNFLAIGGINVDVTERHELERQLQQAQKLEAIGKLTGGVAHDFNNLLAVILGNSELLTEKLADQPELKRLSATVEVAAERGAELTERLLAYARQQGLEPTSFNANELIQGFRTLLERSLGEAIEVEMSFAEDLWPTYADTGQLENALLNLAINARDAMPEGGKLLIETENAVLDDSYPGKDEDFRPGDYVTISVTDNGEGMSEAVMEQAFDPFFTTKEVGQGSGLGLSMVYGYLKQSGGFARIYSEAGIGTKVTLYLPAAQGSAPKPGPKAGRAETPGGRERILVVEDNQLVRSNVIAQLAGLGYSTLEAADGKEALKILNSDEPIDLLFTDMIMPGGLHGYDLARKALSLRPGLKVVMTTGFSDISRLELSGEVLDLPILRKPYHRAELAQILRQTLEGESGASS